MARPGSGRADKKKKAVQPGIPRKKEIRETRERPVMHVGYATAECGESTWVLVDWRRLPCLPARLDATGQHVPADRAGPEDSQRSSHAALRPPHSANEV